MKRSPPKPAHPKWDASAAYRVFIQIAIASLMLAYAYYRNELMIIAIAGMALAAYRSGPVSATAIFALGLFTASLAYYFGQAGIAFGLAIADFAVLAGCFSGALINFRDEQKGDKKAEGKKNGAE
jgi:hypothetical protein